MNLIVVAIDRSEPSLRAAELAAELAQKYDAELVLLCVVRNIRTRDPGLEAYARMEGLREPVPSLAIDEVHGSLNPVRDRAIAKGARQVSTDVRIGEAAEEILACLTDCGADLVVIGSRGHGRLTGLLLGSVVQKIASCGAAISVRTGDNQGEKVF